jgi:hypothetical protein
VAWSKAVFGRRPCLPLPGLGAAILVCTATGTSAVAKLACQDYFSDGRHHSLRLDEKGGKLRAIPCRTDLQQYIEEYRVAVGGGDP